MKIPGIIVLGIPDGTPGKIPEGERYRNRTRTFGSELFFPGEFFGKTACGIPGGNAVAFTVQVILELFLVKSLQDSSKDFLKIFREEFLRESLEVFLEDLLEPFSSRSQNFEFCQNL